MHWLAFHFPQLHLDSIAETCVENSVEGSAHAFVLVDQKQLVQQLNLRAKQRGIEQGMKLGTALALAEDLRFAELDLNLQAHRLNELATFCYGFSSDVVVRPMHSCLLLEFSAMLKLYGSVFGYVNTLIKALIQQNLSFRLALAGSPMVAELLSRFQRDCFERLAHCQQYQASEYFSALARPEGLAFFKKKAFECFRQLSIECLELPAKQIQQLQRLGLKQVQDVQALPYDELAMRLGKDSIAYLKLLEPKANPPLTRFQAPEKFSLSLSFEEEVQSCAALLFPAKRMLDGLELFLRQRSFQVQTLSLQLFSRTQRLQTIQVFSAEADAQASHWHKLLRLKLENISLAAPVMGVRLLTGAFLSLEVEVQDLFEAPTQQRSIANTLSKLEARLGEGSLRQPRMKASHVPEQSVEYASLQSSKERNKHWEVSEPLRAYARQTLRPSLLLKNPEPLGEAIRIIHGPERIQSAWWQGDLICRDYFVACNAHKQLLWVFRNAQEQWFVHGLFA